jgi:hypothetical protein
MDAKNQGQRQTSSVGTAARRLRFEVVHHSGKANANADSLLRVRHFDQNSPMSDESFNKKETDERN